MSIRKSYGPCDCGADDCRRCYPEHFKNGRYICDDEDDEDIDDRDASDFVDQDDYHDDAAEWGGMSEWLW